MEQLQPWFQVDLYITVHFIDCLHVSKTKKTTLWSIASSLRHLGGLWLIDAVAWNCTTPYPPTKHWLSIGSAQDESNPLSQRAFIQFGDVKMSK